MLHGFIFAYFLIHIKKNMCSLMTFIKLPICKELVYGQNRNIFPHQDGAIPGDERFIKGLLSNSPLCSRKWKDKKRTKTGVSLEARTVNISERMLLPSAFGEVRVVHFGQLVYFWFRVVMSASRRCLVCLYSSLFRRSVHVLFYLY